MRQLGIWSYLPHVQLPLQDVEAATHGQQCPRGPQYPREHSEGPNTLPESLSPPKKILHPGTRPERQSGRNEASLHNGRSNPEQITPAPSIICSPKSKPKRQLSKPAYQGLSILFSECERCWQRIANSKWLTALRNKNDLDLERGNSTHIEVTQI